ncbi:hypothetical protein BU15DRAFT_60731 [Melanogaster broomeanus]|nr:hypothetical protein BU15DRAFT_60731 [Melanogaster broomeanus]
MTGDNSYHAHTALSGSYRRAGFRQDDSRYILHNPAIPGSTPCTAEEGEGKGCVFEARTRSAGVLGIGWRKGIPSAVRFKNLPTLSATRFNAEPGCIYPRGDIDAYSLHLQDLLIDLSSERRKDGPVLVNGNSSATYVGYLQSTPQTAQPHSNPISIKSGANMLDRRKGLRIWLSRSGNSIPLAGPVVCEYKSDGRNHQYIDSLNESQEEYDRELGAR